VSEERFYHEGFDPAKGLKGAIIPLRRAIRRVLRPMFVRLGDQIDSLAARLDLAENRINELSNRHDETNDQLQATVAFGWDYVAMARRLAALEDEISRLRRSDSTNRDDPRQLVLPLRDQSDKQPHAKAS
jgi:uncharacterized coiled-coil DUF342 family protein